MRPGRTILAVLAGYLTLIVLEILGSALLAGVLHGAMGGVAIVGGECIVFFSGVVAGAVTARLAPMRPLSHATALGLAVFSATALAAAIAHPPSQQQHLPNWYPYALAALGGVGAFVGGALASGSRREA